MIDRDEVIRLALESGLGPDWAIVNCHDQLERFAALVAASEREACAKVCDAEAAKEGVHRVKLHAAIDCAAAIRARSQPALTGEPYCTGYTLKPDTWPHPDGFAGGLTEKQP